VGRTLTRVVVELISLPRVTIGSLPDNVLLDVFDFYLPVSPHPEALQTWHELVHVCRRWRYGVFASPRRLGLQLLCTGTTPVRKTLDVWPRLPIVVYESVARSRLRRLREGNIITALEHHDRIYKITVHGLTSSLLKQHVTVMQKRFSELTELLLWMNTDHEASVTVLPDTFLGGSAPRLQSLSFMGIPFPTLPKLLRTSNDLVSLRLLKIPNTGYFSPEAMAVCLSALTRLDYLSIEFQTPTSRPDRRRPPPLTRVFLLALTKLEFKGVSEYFEDLVARISTPVLRFFKISFFNQLFLDIPQLSQFIRLTGQPGLFKRITLWLTNRSAGVDLYKNHLPFPYSRTPPSSHIDVSCGAFDWQISGLTQICNQLSLLFSDVEQLEIKYGTRGPSGREDDIDGMQWLELFQPFIAVKNLDIATGLDEHIVSALQELNGDRAMEVLPALCSLSFQRPKTMVRSGWKALEQFVVARQLANHPITIHTREY
jgi:hypothetical protein